MDKIEHRADFSYVRYANCWEDTGILCKALDPGPGQKILSIASAGDNSLALVATGAEVVAADLSLSQLACVELRKEAIRILDHEDCLCFFGIRPAENRMRTYSQLREGLSRNAMEFWDAHPAEIKAGFIHCGKFEQFFRVFRERILSLIHSRKTVESLLQKRSRDERYLFYQEEWANWRWHLLFKVFFSRLVMGRIGRDPEFFRYVEVPVSESILQRTKFALTELETHSNPYLDYILTGNFTNSLPYYLQPDIFENIKKNIDGLVLFHGPVQDAVKQAGNKGFDGFNLSDVFEYLDEKACSYIYEILLDHAKSGSRLVYWNMLVPRSCPPGLQGRIKAKEELSRELFGIDKAFFYSNFIIEEVL